MRSSQTHRGDQEGEEPLCGSRGQFEFPWAGMNLALSGALQSKYQP